MEKLLKAKVNSRVNWQSKKNSAFCGLQLNFPYGMTCHSDIRHRHLWKEKTRGCKHACAHQFLLPAGNAWRMKGFLITNILIWYSLSVQWQQQNSTQHPSFGPQAHLARQFSNREETILSQKDFRLIMNQSSIR